MDPYIEIKRNSLGFRGKEPNKSIPELFSIITMGGSTTECVVLSDGSTWPDILEQKLSLNISDLWVGNAGVDGQSSFGHIPYLEESVAPKKPKVILFLIGANEQNQYYLDEHTSERTVDFGVDEKTNYDIKPVHHPRVKKGYYISLFFRWVNRHRDSSSIFLTLAELRRRHLAQFIPNSYKTVDFEKLKQRPDLLLEHYTFNNQEVQLSGEVEIDLRKLPQKSRDISRVLNELRAQVDYKKKVRSNLQRLIDLSRANQALPVFITQPALFGNGKDPETGVNLATMELQSGNVGWGHGLSGLEMWTMLEAYNNIVREVAKQNKVKLIDLAKQMPKNSLYYYDFIHYSKPGAQVVSEIIYKELCPYLSETFFKEEPLPCK